MKKIPQKIPSTYFPQNPSKSLSQKQNLLKSRHKAESNFFKNIIYEEVTF